jgi:hypothetical protein
MDGLRAGGHHEREGGRGQCQFRDYVEEFHELSPYDFVYGPLFVSWAPASETLGV